MNDIKLIVTADAFVRRQKQNYYIIIQDKIANQLPWGSDGVLWLDNQHPALGDRTPREVIEADEGHLAEELIEKLVHLHEATLVLDQCRQRYSDVPELVEVWTAFERALPNVYQTLEVG